MDAKYHGLRLHMSDACEGRHGIGARLWALHMDDNLLMISMAA